MKRALDLIRELDRDDCMMVFLQTNQYLLISSIGKPSRLSPSSIRFSTVGALPLDRTLCALPPTLGLLYLSPHYFCSSLDFISLVYESSLHSRLHLCLFSLLVHHALSLFLFHFLSWVGTHSIFRLII
ncbi:hypothetical protein Scep_010101 [Stephania cephalantha]|uniref:Uncharacterized protein n=1 Tax=Stephania cephalantha TaxID=152367 RepID=A0AAP0JVF2_9MAGN